MAVERYYSGDPASASKFNTLVAAICNLQRKVNELKRRPKANLLRNNSFARYPYACRKTGCGCGFINCYCVKICVGKFPIYKPPFNMHWKMTEINGSEVRTNTLEINQGYWFRGRCVVEVPSQSIDNAQSGNYYIMRCGTEFVRGQSCKNIPCNVWLIGKVVCAEITDKWSGDIYQEPSPYEPDTMAITDHARFVADRIVFNCGIDRDYQCVLIPARSFQTDGYENPPQHCEGAYMLFSGDASHGNMVNGWYNGCVCVAGNVPQLRVVIHGRESDTDYYDGQTIYVCHSFENGYTYQCLVNGVVGVIAGYARQDSYSCRAYSCIWIDVPVVPQQNAIAFWGAEQENCFQGTGVEIIDCWQPRDNFTVLARGFTEKSYGSGEFANWKFVNYIADVALCKKEPVDTVYSVPKKSTVSETYYTGENCNGT